MSFDALIRPAIAGLGTHVIGHDVRTFASNDSTNTWLRNQALAGAAEGLVAVADEQTAGRGRMGRAWSAPAGANLLFSTLLRPTWLQPEDGFWLTMLAATAFREALAETLGVDVGIKWPNDLVHADAKLAGILVEAEAQAGPGMRWAIIGCGINVAWHPDPAAVGQAVTSLAALTGATPERGQLLAALLQRLDQRYLALRRGQREALRSTWSDHLVTLGRQVRVEYPDGTTLIGVAESVAPDGALIVVTAAGEPVRVLAADVRVRPTTAAR